LVGAIWQRVCRAGLLSCYGIWFVFGDCYTFQNVFTLDLVNSGCDF